jgi:hypothetical protein
MFCDGSRIPSPHGHVEWPKYAQQQEWFPDE